MKQRVLLKGGDAIDLLHRISTANVNGLGRDEKTPALFLNPQGKILCLFQITKQENDALEIEFDENFLETLDRYTFAERYEIVPLPPSPESEPNEADRIRDLTPKLGHEFKNDGQTNPLEVNLRSAIHDQKGCYPGQEVIEKIIAIGSPARKLCLFQGAENTASFSEALPTPLLDPATGAEVGVLTSFADDGVHRGIALGIVKRTHLKEGLSLQTPGKTVFTLERIS